MKITENQKSNNDKARKIIELLDHRCGFDGWWGSIDDSIQSEIIEELADELGEADDSSDEHCINLDGTENLGTFGGEGLSHEDGFYPEYGLDFGSFKVFGLKPEQMSKLGCEIINHLIVNGHRFDIGKTGWPDTIEEIN